MSEKSDYEAQAFAFVDRLNEKNGTPYLFSCRVGVFGVMRFNEGHYARWFDWPRMPVPPIDLDLDAPAPLPAEAATCGDGNGACVVNHGGPWPCPCKCHVPAPPAVVACEGFECKDGAARHWRGSRNDDYCSCRKCGRSRFNPAHTGRP